jgi:hypothetical protein
VTIRAATRNEVIEPDRAEGTPGTTDKGQAIAG